MPGIGAYVGIAFVIFMIWLIRGSNKIAKQEGLSTK